MRWIALVALVPLSAVAEDGFFRHQESSPYERAESGDTQAAGPGCALVVRYNTGRPSAQEIIYVGPQGICLSKYLTAIRAAATMAKVAGPTDPIPGLYDCTTLVTFDPAKPKAPSVATTGEAACIGLQGTALAAAAQNVTCVFASGPCAQ